MNPRRWDTTTGRDCLAVVIAALVLHSLLLWQSEALPDWLVWAAATLSATGFVLLIIWILLRRSRPGFPLDAMPGAMIRIDPWGRVLDANAASLHEVPVLRPGMRLHDFLDGDSRYTLDQALTEPLHRSIHEVEVLLSQRRFRLGIASPAVRDGARVVQLTDITVFRDVSVRLAMNEQRYRSLFSENPDAVFSLDLRGRFVEANRVTLHLTGCHQAELVSRRWQEFFEPEHQSILRSNFRAAAGGNPCSFRAPLTHLDGSTAQLQVTYVPIVVNGRVSGVFGVARDNTERYRLEERRRLLSASVAQIQDAIIITEMAPLDEPGPRIVYVNAGTERMTGFRADELIGHTPRIFQGPETDRAALDRIRTALKGRFPVKETLVNYCKDGRPFWNEIEIVPIPARRFGHKSYFASVQRDVSKAKQRELQLQHSREELRRLNSAQQQLLENERGRIARDLHDQLGQTLTAMRLDLGVTLRDLPDLPQAQAQRLTGLIAVVDTTIEQVREISANLRPPMLDDLGFEATAEWFLDKCARREGLDIQWNPTPDGRGQIRGDAATALFRILQECMTNISRYSQASVVVIDYEEDEGEARLVVRDNGVGFDPGSAGNSGFGLFGMRERVAMLGGSLAVESAIGKGVRVVATLPLEELNHD